MHTEGEVDRQAKLPDLPNFRLAVRLFQFEDHIHERIFRGFRSGDHAIFQYTAVVDAHIFEDVGIIVGDVKFQISRLFHGECAGRLTARVAAAEPGVGVPVGLVNCST